MLLPVLTGLPHQYRSTHVVLSEVCIYRNLFLYRMASENAAEVAALRGWKVYFNTLTIPGRRNVSVFSLY